MDQTKLVELIKIIQPEERLDLIQFSYLNLFNNGRMRIHVPVLLKVCLEHPWHIPTQKLEKESVYAIVFKQQKFIEGKLEKVMVEAHRVVSVFLMNQFYFRKENEFQQIIDFAEIVRIRGVSHRYDLSIVQLKKMQAENQCRDYRYFQKQIQLELAIHYKESIDNKSKGDLNIPNLYDSIETYYYLRRIALLCRYILQSRITKLDIPKYIQFQIDECHLPERCLEASTPLQVNFEIFKVMRKEKPNISDVRRLFEMVRHFEYDFDLELLQEFYTYLRNFASLILISDQEDEEAETFLHALNKDNLHRGFLYYEGKISPSRYLAVTNNAIRAHAFDWALEFVEQHKSKVQGDNASFDLYRFNKAHCLFAFGNFTACLDYLPATSSYLDYFLLGKRLELKALYELQSDLLSYKLDAFRMYLSRTSKKVLSDTLRLPHQDFANFLQQLISSLPGDKIRSAEIVCRLEERKRAAEYRWLLQKAKALATGR